MSSEVDEPQSTGMEGWHAEERSKPLQGFITLQEKILRHVHLTVRAQGDLLQHTHTNGSRAETQDAYRRDISQVKEYELNNRKSEISSNSEQMNQSNENWQLHQNSLNRNFTRDYFLKSKEIRYSQKQNLREICKESRAERSDCAIRELNRQIHSHRVEIYHTNQGCESSRREQA